MANQHDQQQNPALLEKTIIFMKEWFISYNQKFYF